MIPEHDAEEDTRVGHRAVPPGGDVGTTGRGLAHFDSEKDRRVWVFVIFWAMGFAMTLAPGAPWHGWRGGLLGIAGLTMLLHPPRVRIPRLWAAMAAGFMILAGMVFLPANWLPVPEWRERLSAAGLPLGNLMAAQPLQTMECLAGFAICLIMMLYLTGHRVDHGGNHLLGLLFTMGVALVALFAMGAQDFQWSVPWDPENTFGFFANRNHMATLLVMGIMTGAGVIVQSLRVQTWVSGIAALASVIVCVRAIIGYSGSRAGVVLLACIFTGWLLFLGRNYLRGRILLATGLLASGAILYYASGEYVVKKRLDETAEHLALIVDSGREEIPLWKGKRGSDSLEALDARLPIYRDTLDMLHDQPWTGVGAGQFQYVFPQYRNRSAFLNNSQSVHPESDWLLMASEAGIPATLVLAGLVCVVGWSALRFALRGRARALRTGCIFAAAVVPVHGLFDVPGHRMELVWAACWLVAISLRGSRETFAASPGTRLIFRTFGAGVIAAGAFLIYAQWFGGRPPSRMITAQTLEKVETLYEAEMADFKAADEGVPVITPADDRLEKAIGLLDDALQSAPMDPHLHYLKGAISLYFDDKDAGIDRAFALQRLLDPTWVEMPLLQAAAWSRFDAARTERLWAEAMRRAAALEKIDPGMPYGRAAVFTRIVNAARATELIRHAVRAAGADTEFLETWAARASRDTLDATLPEILTLERSEVRRRALFQIWCSRGTRQKAEDYARKDHPDLLEAP